MKTKNNKLTASEIEGMLDDLSTLRRQILSNQDKHDRLVEKLLGPVTMKKMKRLSEELHKQNDDLYEEATGLETEIRELVGRFGKNVEVEDLVAVYVQPRVRWDSKGLDGFAAAHPEVLKLKTVDEFGSAQIRRKKE